MQRAWVSRLWRDDGGKRHREKCEAGTVGVRPTDEFQIEWREPSGQRRAKLLDITGKPGKRAADRMAADITLKLQTGTYEAERRVEWATFADRYLEYVKAKSAIGTYDLAKAALAHFKRLCKPVLIRGVNAGMIDDYVAKRRVEPVAKDGRLVAPATINRELRTLRAALRKAHRWGLLANVAAVEFQREPESHKPWLSEEHFAKIYDACPQAAELATDVPYSPGDWWQALVTYAYLTGWRIGQILSLRWQTPEHRGVDLEAGTAYVPAEFTKGKRDDLIVLHPVVIAHLARLRSFDVLVFPWPHDRRTLWTQFYRIQKAAGVKPEGAEHYGFHDFRRGFATLNAERLSADVLQRLMAHRSYSTTQRYISMAHRLKPAAHSLFVPKILGTSGGSVEAATSQIDVS